MGFSASTGHSSFKAGIPLVGVTDFPLRQRLRSNPALGQRRIRATRVLAPC
jgi:hypothetical protein